MKLLHYFVTHDCFKRRYLVGNDSCIYCNIKIQILYNKLTIYQKLEIKNVHLHWFQNDVDYFKADCKFYNKYSSCPNGITEEEFIIKSIIE